MGKSVVVLEAYQNHASDHPRRAEQIPAHRSWRADRAGAYDQRAEAWNYGRGVLLDTRGQPSDARGNREDGRDRVPHVPAL